MTAIAISLGTGFCTYFVTVHGKEKEWQRSEKTRKEARLYQQRSRQYELLQPILLRVASLGKSRLGWGIPNQGSSQSHQGFESGFRRIVESSESQSFHELLILAGNIDQIRLSG